jgi:hypothetical protein
MFDRGHRGVAREGAPTRLVGASRGVVVWDPRGTLRAMPTREELHALVDSLPEPQLPTARIVVEEDEPDIVGRPKGWGTMDNGQPVPNVVAAIRRSREAH